MKILTISGSSRPESANARLLNALSKSFSQHDIYRFEKIAALPLFRAEMDQSPYPELVLQWRAKVEESDALIIATPEYIHNLPAAVKNALEWLTTSGELMSKPVLAITFTPHAPRGERAMQSLIWSLQALEARVVAQLPLYQNEVEFSKNGGLIQNESFEILEAAITLLT